MANLGTLYLNKYSNLRYDEYLIDVTLAVAGFETEYNNMTLKIEAIKLNLTLTEISGLPSVFSSSVHLEQCDHTFNGKL